MVMWSVNISRKINRKEIIVIRNNIFLENHLHIGINKRGTFLRVLSYKRESRRVLIKRCPFLDWLVIKDNETTLSCYLLSRCVGKRICAKVMTTDLTGV